MPTVKSKDLIPLSEPLISGNEWKYIKDCLDTGWVSTVGAYVTRFEEAIADYIGAKYAVATVNGTSALHVSLIACGVQPNDEVLVPALTFISPVNVIHYCNAYPVFMDCNTDTLCIDVQKVVDFIRKECELRSNGYAYNKETNRRVKAVIPVHIFGHPTDMDMLLDVCVENNIDIIEDATESLGSEYKGEKTGSFGKAGCFSFNGNKIITAGGGGMVVTDDDDLSNKIRHLTTQAKRDSFEYDHDEVGYNYRLNNIQAAMGVAQMEKIDDFVQVKRKNANYYIELLANIKGLEFLRETEWAKSNYWLCTIKGPKEHKKLLIDHLLSENIQARPIWKLIHSLPMYSGFQSYQIERAVDAYESCISLPSSVNIKQSEIEYIVNHIAKYFERLPQ
ncbi:MAG: LegC family aminotransferase [Candidatus Scalindua sp.]|nr:LegC family aminotransferase [Candidatus Scalindua sp.]